MNIKIRNNNLKHGLFLAPMAGFTDYTFRKICRENGAEFTVSEMVSAKALCYEQLAKRLSPNQLKTAPLAEVKEEEMPMSVQLFGSEPEFVAEAAEMIECCSYRGCLSKIPPAAIDINMGCPMHKVVSNGEGSALMKNPVLAAKIVETVEKKLKNIPVTVKIRAGWNEENKNAPEMAKRLEAAGAAAIFVHARTREEMYNPGIDLSVIEKVKKSVKIPVIGNGDICSADDAAKMLDICGCDGLMIGRGALGNPWIFAEISARLDGEEFIAPTLNERLDTCLYHIKTMREQKGEHISSAEIKKHAVLYIKNIRSAAALRDRIMKTNSTYEIEDIINQLKIANA